MTTEDLLKGIRWRQRFQNLQKAATQLDRGLAIDLPSEIEMQGIIQSFEFTFELAWKTLKDYMEALGTDTHLPRETIKSAFHAGLINNGEIWLDMLDKRNLLAHTYDEKLAETAYQLIRDTYVVQIRQLILDLEGKADEPTS